MVSLLNFRTFQIYKFFRCLKKNSLIIGPIPSGLSWHQIVEFSTTTHQFSYRVNSAASIVNYLLFYYIFWFALYLNFPINFIFLSSIYLKLINCFVIKHRPQLYFFIFLFIFSLKFVLMLFLNLSLLSRLLLVDSLRCCINWWPCFQLILTNWDFNVTFLKAGQSSTWFASRFHLEYEDAINDRRRSHFLIQFHLIIFWDSLSSSCYSRVEMSSTIL